MENKMILIFIAILSAVSILVAFGFPLSIVLLACAGTAGFVGRKRLKSSFETVKSLILAHFTK